MNLPAKLDFTLFNWEERDFVSIRKNTKALSSMAQSVGESSQRFQRVRSELLMASRQDFAALHRRIEKPIDVRALSDLLCSQNQSEQTIQLTTELVDLLTKPKAHLSTLTLTRLITAYCSRYDQFGNPDGLKALGILLQSQLEKRQRLSHTSQVSLYAKHRSILFSGNAQKVLADRARSSGSFEKTIREMGLSTQSHGRLVTLARAYYYVDGLKKLPVGEESPLLEKVTLPEIYNAPLDKEKLIGHAVLHILISRANSDSVSDFWRNAILSIAGDPRVPHSNPRYQKWWSRLKPELVQKVYGWLAGFDLKLFLDALEQYGKDEQDRVLQRMYPARKRFLEGLLKQNLVTNTRLFISRHMEHYLKKSYKPDELPAYAIVKSDQRSMIYLNVGGVHIIEGSHNRAMYGVPQIPKSSQILNPSIREFQERSLGRGLLEQFEVEFKNKYQALGDLYRDQLEVQHKPDKFYWEHIAIEYLKSQKVMVDVEALFTKTNYHMYKRIHGLR